MKRLISIVSLTFSIVFFSCSSDDGNKTITFFNDSTFTSKGSLCNMGIEADTESLETFSNNKIFVNSCPNLSGTIRTYKMENTVLEVYYPCIEPCAEKYVKIE